MEDLLIIFFHFVQRIKATVEVRKALQYKLEEMIRNEDPVKEVSIVLLTDLDSELVCS